MSPIQTAGRILSSVVRKKVGGEWTRLVVPYDHGRSKIIADLTTSLGLGLYRYGLRDDDIEFVSKLLKPGDVVVDGGAHVGLYTLVAANRVASTGRVYSFEPATETRKKLQDNLELNGFDWVKVFPNVVLNESRLIDFTSFGGNGSGLSSIKPPEDMPEGTTQKIQSITLDEAILPADRSRVRLVKLDLEGAELQALQGAEKLIVEASPDFLLEIEPARYSELSARAKEILKFLEQRGYRYSRISSDGLIDVHQHESPAGSPNIFFSKQAHYS